MVLLNWILSWCISILGLGQADGDVEKSKAVAVVFDGRVKKKPRRPSKLSSKVAWGKLLSQCSQVGFALCWVFYWCGLALAKSRNLVWFC